MALVACPFCREMFEKGEHAVCPTCGVALEDFSRLGASHDAASLDDELGNPPPEPKVLFASWGLGRGPLLVVIVIGFGAFFLPWIHLEFPWSDTRTGFDLSRGRLGWMWGVGCAWFVALPVVLSRRTATQMRSSRVPIASLALMPLIALGVLLAFPPTQLGGIKVRFHYGVGAWITCVAALAALAIATRFGVESRTSKRNRVPKTGGAFPTAGAQEEPSAKKPPSTLH